MKRNPLVNRNFGKNKLVPQKKVDETTLEAEQETARSLGPRVVGDQPMPGEEGKTYIGHIEGPVPYLQTQMGKDIEGAKGRLKNEETKFQAAQDFVARQETMLKKAQEDALKIGQNVEMVKAECEAVLAKYKDLDQEEAAKKEADQVQEIEAAAAIAQEVAKKQAEAAAKKPTAKKKTTPKAKK